MAPKAKAKLRPKSKPRAKATATNNHIVRAGAKSEVERTPSQDWTVLCKHIFGSLDADGSGYIEAEVLHEILAKLGWPRTRSEKLFRALDMDGDQRVCYNDLVDWLSDKGTKDDVQVSNSQDGLLPFVQIAERCISAGSNAASVPADRETLTRRLHSHDFMHQDDLMFWHGRAYKGPTSKPDTTWACDVPPRDDHETPSWLTASEFEDVAEVMQTKVAQLANLLRLSTRTVIYTGAGISASAVGQAARSGQHTVGWKSSPKTAPPTFTHFVLGLLGKQDLVQSWVQQNHDGLPQKAGYPQEKINEIHGSWYDPSNPVVLYSGCLKSDQFEWLQRDIEHADLVIVFGSTLGGLFADRVAKEAAERSRHGGLGAVCVNLQQTPLDGMMTLRIFGSSDDVLRLLLQELDLTCIPSALPVCADSCALVPYDAEGHLLAAEEGKRMWLNLNVGQEVRINEGNNIQGCRQPKYSHIGATEPASYLGVLREPAEPCGVVCRREDESHSFVLWVGGVEMNLGIWWLDVSRRGAVQQLPVMNRDPQYEGETPEGPRALPADVGKVWWEIGKIEGYEPKKLQRSIST